MSEEMSPQAKAKIVLRRILEERRRRGNGLADVVAMLGDAEVKMVSAVARLPLEEQRKALADAAQSIHAQALVAVYEGVDRNNERRVCCVLIERGAHPVGWAVALPNGSTILPVTDEGALAMAAAIPSLLGVLA